jgi:hypothetical protein
MGHAFSGWDLPRDWALRHPQGEIKLVSRVSNFSRKQLDSLDSIGVKRVVINKASRPDSRPADATGSKMQVHSIELIWYDIKTLGKLTHSDAAGNLYLNREPTALSKSLAKGAISPNPK